MKRFFLPAMALLFAPGCDSQAPSMPEIKAPPVPAQICAQAKEGLQTLATRALIEYDDKGQASVAQEIWIQMDAQRGQFSQMLALHAACAHPDGSRTRHVLIRNESGVILLENDVPTDIGLGSLPDE